MDRIDPGLVLFVDRLIVMSGGDCCLCDDGFFFVMSGDDGCLLWVVVTK